MSLFYWTQRKICWRLWETEQFWGTIDPHSIFFPTMEVNGAPKQVTNFLLKYLPLCSAEKRHSYRFGTTWVWVNYDRIFIFGWTIPLNLVWKMVWKRSNIQKYEQKFCEWKYQSSEDNDQTGLSKRLPGLMGLNFCLDIQMVGSEFGVNNIKAWIHPAQYQRFRLLVWM